MPIALISTWNSISQNRISLLVLLLITEVLLLAVFLALDVLLFYIFFESILIPLFLIIGLFGSSNKVKASFYLFLYTLAGSLFLLLAILTINSIMGTTDYDAIFKTNFSYSLQVFLFIGAMFSFFIKTPVYFFNIWLLKAHVESPLVGSIILAAIVLKLSLYGIFRIVLPVLPQVSLNYTYIVYLICVITIIYSSFSTLRTTDIKELIAYSSVSHAAVYLLGAFSNSTIGIEGSILLGLAHGFTSSALFICVGGVLYERTGTRLIYFYRGLAQTMPIFSVLFTILCFANCGVPLTLNFVGEFLCLYGAFERLPVLGALASCSIILSAAYSIYMLNRIVFGGSFFFIFFSLKKKSMIDLTKREFFILFILVLFTVILGIYPSIILDGLHPSVSSLIFSENVDLITDAPQFKNSILPVVARNYSTLATLRRSFVKPQGDYKIDPFFVIGPVTSSKLPTTRYLSASSSSDREIYKLHPEWVTGFVDGEGCFHLSITSRKDRKLGWEVRLCFEIHLNEKDFALL